MGEVACRAVKDRVVRLFAAVAATLLLCCSTSECMTAFAYDGRYLDPCNWQDVQCESGIINQHGVFGTLRGDYKYFFDSDNSCFYLYLSVSEENIYSNADVAVEMSVANSSAEYRLSVVDNGVDSPTDNISDYFTVNTNFTTFSNNSGVYLIAVEIHNGSNQNELSFSVHTASGRYNIAQLKNIAVESTDKKKVTTKSRKSTTAKKTTKRRTTTTKRKKSSSRTTNPTKYYNPNPTTQYTRFDGKVPDDIASSEYTTQILSTPETDMRGKGFRIAGITMATVGAGFLIAAVVSTIIGKMKKSSTVDQPPPDDDDDEFCF